MWTQGQYRDLFSFLLALNASFFLLETTEINFKVGLPLALEPICPARQGVLYQNKGGEGLILVILFHFIAKKNRLK